MGGGDVNDILVIDDDSAVRDTLRRVLESAGFRVRVAADGEQGLEAFRHETAALVITDIIMPEKEGMATIMDLRAMAPSLPILAISGGGRVGNADFLNMAKRLGATEILGKPFDGDALVARVRQLLGLDE
jgi:DNA-binding response OmpR family regulator